MKINMEKKLNPVEKKDVFLLGGADLEMYQIEKRLRRGGKEFVSRNLQWGAKIDDYNDAVQKILEEGNIPVAVELTGADKTEGVVDIDHHNEKSGRPAAIAQVMDRIGKPMGLVDEMIAANDSAYIPGMQAKMEEYRSQLVERYGEEKFEKLKKKLIDLIRRKDREMQGVTAQMEQAAEEAISNAEHGPNGLIIVRFPGTKPSPITDRLFVTGGKQNLCVVCKSDEHLKDVYYFGRGDICKEIKDTFSAEKLIAWGGGTGYGKSDEIGFGGATIDDPEKIIHLIQERQ